jgi:hypothetical protein
VLLAKYFANRNISNENTAIAIKSGPNFSSLSPPKLPIQLMQVIPIVDPKVKTAMPCF